MNIRSIFFFFLIFMACKNSEVLPSSTDHFLSITPKPLRVVSKNEKFEINKNTSFLCKDESSKIIANFFVEKIKARINHSFTVSDTGNTNNRIQLIKENTLGFEDEEYHLSISENDIKIKAKTDRGLFYGMQTFMQLLPLYNHDVIQLPFKINAVDIEDKPRFSWRGMHLDVSRHFFSVDFIKKQLDVLSLFKINKFHWHLTDDQGWRIEIKKYPKLTTIGSKRKDVDGSYHQGYYTQEEIREVVRYAKDRFIDIVPEFDTPGHAIAILAAYPELSCDNKEYEVRNLWGIESSILCAGKEETYTFIENVIKELSFLFPYEYYHMGGDEVPKEQWKNSLTCQQLKKEKGLKDENEIQSYFMSRVEKILEKYNKKMIGWDEILEGGITPTTNIMSWQGEEGGIKAANEGHDVIMTPVEYTYLNFYQGDYKVEPLAFGGYISLEKTYNYDPIPKEIKIDKRKHILGAQGNLWTEYASQEKTIEYLLYPRIIALAETTWTPKENKDFDNFLKRLNTIYNVLDHYNISHHIPLPEGPTSDKITFIDSVNLEFTTTHPVKMIYTTDGTDPNGNSEEYTKPLLFTETSELRIASILDNGKMSTIRKLSIIKEKPIAPLNTSELSKGLVMKEIKGHFKNVNDIKNNTKTHTSTIKRIKDSNTTYSWGHEVNEDNFRAVFLDGFVDIPEDGVYYFSSVQDQVWVADQLLIDYKTPLKKHPKESSIALQKGKHKLKIVYLNNIAKGWATDWNTVELKYRKASEMNYKEVDEHMIFH
ncbi:family 20 glycosylhydrolase [Aquimarina algiphila]|uniref:beta-N-acetylhexosaminidase n=1 Tax=Aquimarina algiphila TaxID=2047982 RepID=A0A554VQ02_9FLAO|nr:family 20 glycosylhydrolase [Aquimarina algiphila]TSE10572.1 family 20 glycosylhydrolase [Aquimarina algiphila]